MYSAVIVGAGPAGSTTARFLAELGRDALIVDKKEAVGVPKRCAEAIFRPCLAEFSTGSGNFTTGKISQV